MATIDLGKIKLVWRGTYNNSTAYVVDDIVEFTDSGITSTYICVANSTGNNPSSGGTAHASWNYMAKGVVDPIPTQSGNSGKFLKTNGSALSFDNVTQAIKSVHSKIDGGRHSVNTEVTDNNWGNMTSWSQMEITLTPDSASSKFHITGALMMHHYGSYTGHVVVTYTHGGTEYAVVANSDGTRKRTIKGEAHGDSGSDMQSGLPLDLIAEPNTTNQIVFKIRISVFASSYPWYLNRTGSNTTNDSDGGDVLSSWTITEYDGSLVSLTRTSAQQTS
tara:strand:- start:372 stop:1199 length:828 start_codon:yes stop_codon:yes gene_type:complete